MHLKSPLILASVAAVIVITCCGPVLAAGQTPPNQASPKAPSPLLPDVETRKILENRIEVERRGVGIVVGIISPECRRVISYGKLNQGDSRPLDGETVFEIGSVTKVFTSLLLADMVQHGELALTDPVAKYLPSDVKIPERNGRSITLVDLATHTSGLPFYPTNFPPTEDLAAGTRYSEKQLDLFLSTYKLPEREIGSKWEYSNLGAGLLGRALARRAGLDYETLVRKRITGPLGMKSTAITVSPEMKTKLGVGHDHRLKATPDNNVPTFAAAGSFRSSANDLLTFLAACMSIDKSPLTPAMAAMLETRRPNQLYQIDQALGWWVIGKGDEQVILGGGATIGYGCTVVYDPKRRVGVVVLSNTRGGEEGIAMHLLRPKANPLPKLKPAVVKDRKEIEADLKLFDLYAGKYEPSPGVEFTVERDGDALRILMPSTPKLRLWPETEKDFFVKEDDNLQITFKTDDKGRVTGLILQLGKLPIPAARIKTKADEM